MPSQSATHMPPLRDQSTYHCVVGVKPLLTLGGGVGGDEECRGLAEVGSSVVGLEDVG